RRTIATTRNQVVVRKLSNCHQSRPDPTSGLSLILLRLTHFGHRDQVPNSPSKRTRCLVQSPASHWSHRCSAAAPQETHVGVVFAPSCVRGPMPLHHFPWSQSRSFATRIVRTRMRKPRTFTPPKSLTKDTIFVTKPRPFQHLMQ